MVDLDQKEISEKKSYVNHDKCDVTDENGLVIGYVFRNCYPRYQFWNGYVTLHDDFHTIDLYDTDMDDILKPLITTHEKKVFQYIGGFTYCSNKRIGWDHLRDQEVGNYTTKEMAINEVKFVAYLLKKHHTQLLEAASKLLEAASDD